MKQNIYEIQEELLSIANQIEENNGEVTEELLAKLNLTEESFKNKISDYCKLINKLSQECNVIEAEQQRLESLKSSKLKTIDKLQTVILNSLILFGEKDRDKDIWRVDTDLFKISTRSSVSTEILNPDEVPEKYKSYSLTNLTIEDYKKIATIMPLAVTPKVTDTKISKVEIKKDLLNNEPVPGAQLEYNLSLQIK